MNADVRGSETWCAVTRYFELAYAPGQGRPADLTGVAVRPGSDEIIATATIYGALDRPVNRVIVRVREGGTFERLSDPAGDSCAASWSPDGARLAFLSARFPGSDHSLFVQQGTEFDRIGVSGAVEHYSWAPTSDALILQVAERGAEKSGAEGSGNRPGGADSTGWLPTVRGAGARDPRRALWAVPAGTTEARRVAAELNVWEIAWSGTDRVVAVASRESDESAWYSAGLYEIDLVTGTYEQLYTSERQLGRPAGSPDGTRTAVVAAHCSDRGVIAGTLLVIDRAGAVETVDTAAVDVTTTRWLDADRLVYAGVRGLDSVVGVYDRTARRTRELLVTAAGLGDLYRPDAYVGADESVVAIEQDYRTPARILRCASSGAKVLARLDAPDGLRAQIGECAPVAWRSSDGCLVEGLFVAPRGDGPHPLVVYLHGGPIWSFRDRWLGSNPVIGLLASRGYAVLCPNPRGSSGRGREFVEAVLGAPGRVDCADILAGIDDLVARGMIDAERVGIMGGSYGGYLSSWLITQDRRFKAAVPVSPATHWRTLRYTSSIPAFVTAMVGSAAWETGGVYDALSPLMHAAAARTPCLNVAGALDLCTPASEALQFHRALIEAGTESALVVYPHEGHGVRTFPAVVDFCTRTLDWFERFMPANAVQANPTPSLAATGGS
ncbi:S9 family peptidase [Nocardia vulneris]|uniref:S9 family peptidase n=1 Tax=Nocardia vulneris TaxID=1141657 RepID=UPI0030CE4669